MKMLEDLEEVVRLRDAAEYAAVALSSEEFAEADKAYSDKAAIYIATHHATIRDMAKRMEAAERDAARWRFVGSNPWRAIDILRDRCSTKSAYWREEANTAIDAAMQETGR